MQLRLCRRCGLGELLDNDTDTVMLVWWECLYALCCLQQGAPLKPCGVTSPEHTSKLYEAILTRMAILLEHALLDNALIAASWNSG